MDVLAGRCADLQALRLTFLHALVTVPGYEILAEASPPWRTGLPCPGCLTAPADDTFLARSASMRRRFRRLPDEGEAAEGSSAGACHLKG
jgi:hypothetical protein